MKETITERLNALQSEYEAGQKMIAELDARRAALTTTLLRIEGAIQILRELTDGASQAANHHTGNGLPGSLASTGRGSADLAAKPT